jgi:hypothetical protein
MLVPNRLSLRGEPYDEVTPQMIAKLRESGPGALIVLDLAVWRYRVTHGKAVSFTEETEVIVYGHGDLLSDEAFYAGDLASAELAEAIDETAYDRIQEWTEHPAPTPSIRGMRDAMARHGLYLHAHPDRLSVGGRYVIRDHYTFAAAPEIRVTTKLELTEHPERRLLVRVFDGCSHVKGWIAKYPYRFNGGMRAAEISRFVTAHTQRA